MFSWIPDRNTENVVPTPSLVFTRIVPACRWTIWPLTHRPSPVPASAGVGAGAERDPVGHDDARQREEGQRDVGEPDAAVVAQLPGGGVEQGPPAGAVQVGDLGVAVEEPGEGHGWSRVGCERREWLPRGMIGRRGISRYLGGVRAGAMGGT